jgi:hypothetical protein
MWVTRRLLSRACSDAADQISWNNGFLAIGEATELKRQSDPFCSTDAGLRELAVTSSFAQCRVAFGDLASDSIELASV